MKSDDLLDTIRRLDGPWTFDKDRDPLTRNGISFTPTRTPGNVEVSWSMVAAVLEKLEKRVAGLEGALEDADAAREF